jgi:hypothetical protein
MFARHNICPRPDNIFYIFLLYVILIYDILLLLLLLFINMQYKYTIIKKKLNQTNILSWIISFCEEILSIE